MTANHTRVSDIILAQLEAAQRGRLNIWTVYDRPRDHPEGFIVRRFEIGGGVTTATGDTLTGEIDDLHEMFERAGLVRLTRSENDEPQIVESWI